MKSLAIIAVFVVLVLVVFVPGCGHKEMVVQDDQEYSIVSFGSADVETKEGETVSCYVVTFTYPVEDASNAPADDTAPATVETKTCGVIKVPVDGLTIDRSLPVNSIIWDKPMTIEGKTYLRVRWNPHSVDKAITRERVREEEPLKK